MNRRNRFKIIIYIVLLLLATSAYAWWLNYNWAQGRDYDRIADMRVLQSELILYYAQFNTFIIPECSEGMAVNFCGGRNGQAVSVASLIDPQSQGVYRYTVEQLADDNFRISFVTETTLPGIPVGKYFLTKDAVVR